MKKHFFIYKLLLLTVFILFTTCYDPVFFRVASEVEPVEPLIKGSPTNIVAFKRAVYVASGIVLYQYTGTTRGSSEPKWYTAKKINGRFLQIASTEKYLYILHYSDTNPNKKTIEKMDETGNWTPVNVNTGSFNNIQNIYSANDTLFISAANVSNSAESYSFFYFSDAGVGGLLGSGEIKGAAYDGTDYYICTKEGVISIIDEAMDPTKDSKSSLEFTGLINLEDNNKTIAAITRDGVLYTVNKTTGGVSPLNVSFDNGRYSTGALAIWRDRNYTPRLLLAGRQDALEYSTDSGYTYGYMELRLDNNGPVGNFSEPGKNPITSDPDNDQFKSTIGKYPVNYILQTPIYIDSNMRLFASTQKNGVWSYKTRNGVPQWNAEADDDP
ncbi:MAG: hypothetical protein LBQ82_09055 [Treponema sp.]|jgi:hypothetical protein|nr:hypothetical protein [Treponema sp.]